MARAWLDDIKILLEYIPEEDALQLASTVCKGQMTFATKAEAVHAILATVSTPEELLKKRKLKREYILRYLWEHRPISAEFPIKANKDQLIKEILTIWHCSSSDSSCEIEPEEMNDAPSSSTSVSPELLRLFAERFLQWFYQLLNDRSAEFGPQHFFGNCYLKVLTQNQQFSLHGDGSLNVAQKISTLVATEQLMFQPNLRGVESCQEPHGTILLRCKGSVSRINHRSETCLLCPYDQTFFVAQDPQCGTWKIQQTTLLFESDVNLNVGMASVTND